MFIFVCLRLISVPVTLVTSTTTGTTTSTLPPLMIDGPSGTDTDQPSGSGTDLSTDVVDEGQGCSIDGQFYMDGMQVNKQLKPVASIQIDMGLSKPVKA